MYAKAFKDLQTTFSLWHVWFYQAYHVISAKYKRTALGSLWISGGMVATSLSLAIVFGGIFGQSLKDALPMIMAGIMCFGFTSYPLSEGQETFIANGSIIKNHAYPFSFYVLEGSTRNIFMFFHNLVVFYISMLIISAIKIPHWSIIPALLLVFIYMNIWGTLTAMMGARYRDLRFLLPYLGQLMSFITPVFWRADQLTGWRKLIVDLNPLYGLLEIVRYPLLGKAAPMHAWLLACIATIVGAVFWLIFFPRLRRRIPFWV